MTFPPTFSCINPSLYYNKYSIVDLSCKCCVMIGNILNLYYVYIWLLRVSTVEST